MNSNCSALVPTAGDSGTYGFESEMQVFEDADRHEFPPANAIVCIGSSSMQGWHDTIKEDLAPVTIIPRGFGGSNMNDALHYADRIVVPYRPRTVVLYEGDNDVAAGISSEKIRDTFLAFVNKLHASLPEARIYVLSIKPSISRWKMWPQMKEANRLIAAECAKDKHLTYIDVASGMLDAAGSPCKELFLNDELHMTRAGYMIWRDAIRPVLVEAELPFEPQNNRGATLMSCRDHRLAKQLLCEKYYEFTTEVPLPRCSKFIQYK